MFSYAFRDSLEVRSLDGASSEYGEPSYGDPRTIKCKLQPFDGEVRSDTGTKHEGDHVLKTDEEIALDDQVKISGEWKDVQSVRESTALDGSIKLYEVTI